jgi:tetratricopeptide (TPR) repeat protein
MSQAVADDLKLIDVRAPLLRILLAIPVILAVLLSWFAVRWYIGDTIAEYSTRLEDNGIDSARTAMRLSPDDPLTHWSVATLLKNSLAPSDLQESLKSFEDAVSLSPNDYRYWVDLGRARSQAGDLSGAGKALKQAVALAPNYSFPRWYYGNLLLREGQTDEAFAELRKAADSDPGLRPQIFNVAVHVYGDDIETIKNVLGGAPDARAQLVNYLIGRNRVDDAIKVWSSLGNAEKAADKNTSGALMNALIAAKRFRPALEVYRETAGDKASEAAPGKFINPSFEDPILEPGQSPFGWQVRSSPPQLQVAFDKTARHGGERSLRVIFKSSTQFNFNNVSQLVVTDPSSQYHLEFWVRAEDLKSVGTPVIDVVDEMDGKVIATSTALHVGTSDWQLETIDFKTGAKTEAVTVRTDRASCGAETAVCPIFGAVWYDDFNLQHVSGRNTTAASAGETQRSGKK